MQEELKKIEAEALSELKAVASSADLEELRIKYFGRKGLLSTVMRGMGKLSAAERPIIGKLANEVRQNLTRAFEEVGEKFARQERENQLAAEAIDITLPGQTPAVGQKAPHHANSRPDPADFPRDGIPCR